jgi:AcrR family transcriptional regulator
MPARRRTQAERSSETRTRLLEATVECLHELGYAGTSTTVVGARAGVSRGGQLHHFPTKRKLVLAAIEHVLARRLEEFRAAFSQRKARTSAEAVELVWSLSSGSTFYAWLELIVAARTDKTLRTPMRKIGRRFHQGVTQAFHEAFPEQRDNPALDSAPWFTLATLQGFALDRILEPNDPRLPLGIHILGAMGAQAFERVERST